MFLVCGCPDKETEITQDLRDWFYSSKTYLKTKLFCKLRALAQTEPSATLAEFGRKKDSQSVTSVLWGLLCQSNMALFFAMLSEAFFGQGINLPCFRDGDNSFSKKTSLL